MRKEETNIRINIVSWIIELRNTPTRTTLFDENFEFFEFWDLLDLKMKGMRSSRGTIILDFRFLIGI